MNKFSFVIIMFSLQLYVCGSCLDKERASLLELKTYLLTSIGAETIRDNLSSWSDDGNSDCCNWERIKCSNSSGHVIQLSLGNLVSQSLRPFVTRNLFGVLNLSLIHNFEELQSFDFSYNSFSGLFDHIRGFRSFERLKNLRVLNFSYNAFNNSILQFLSAASSLRTLDLEGNRIQGVFPPKELANMTNLKVMNLNLNELRFLSTRDLANFKKLEVLQLRVNHLNGSDAGKGFSHLTKLQTLDLSNNYFSKFSQIQGISNLKKLKTLDLSATVFPNSFQLQDLPFLNLRELKVLKLGFCGLNDTFLAYQALANLKNLQYLDLSDNFFSNFSHVQDLTNLRYMRALILGGNMFNGSLINQVFANLTKLEVLDLSHNFFSVIPHIQGYSGICGLPYLRELDLSNNAFTSLPHCLGNLTHLRTLELSYNQLIGSMPTFLSNLSLLEYLSLLKNNLEGSFSLSSLTNQSSLKTLRVSSNLSMFQIQTESYWIPPFQLTMLQLQNCNLGGPIPTFLLHQHDLRFIDLSHNKLVGTFPSWLLQNNTKLKSIMLMNNLLTEFQLPTLAHGLKYLDISRNRIVGSLRESFGNFFPDLEVSNISNNGFQGLIPPSMGQMKMLSLLDMSSNSLSGQLPRDFLSNCRRLELLILSNNRFQGQIFPEYSNLVILSVLFLDSNNFTSIEIGLLKSKFFLEFLDISSNKLVGKIPSWIVGLSVLGHLRMRRNQLDGPFPHWLQNLTNLYLLDISDNMLSGSIPSNVSYSSLQELSLQNNDLMGPIPDALFESKELQVLDLRNNRLSGEIPKSIGKTMQLGVLLLQKNHLQGHIPKDICNLGNINILDLSYNLLSEFIPSCLNKISFRDGTQEDGRSNRTYTNTIRIGALLSLKVLNFYTPDFSYDIYNYEDSYISQQSMAVEFSVKSRYETFRDQILPYTFGLDLSSNNLSGGIPFQIGDLQNILWLNFSHNRFTGSIPESISNLKNIESLDLSHNMLNASIPAQLANLNRLGYFDVSYNNLSGRIPYIDHLTTFDKRSYIGNTNLCGKPTNKSCNFTEIPSSSTGQFDKDGDDDDDDIIDMDWFYWSASATFVTILLGLLVFLRIDTRWSREWFYRVDLCIYHLQRLKYVSIFK